MSQVVDPTFYRSPAEAVAAPVERLAYVAAYDPTGRAKDARCATPATATTGRWSAAT